jgi:HAD superfamily phosphoserine phosphatase-like hydrolase
MTDPVKVAVYDLDRTITVHGTYTPFMLHCVTRRAPWRLVFVPVVLTAMLMYVFKLIDRRILKSWMLALLLGRCPRVAATALAGSFYDTLQNTGGIRPGALQQIAKDRADGFTLVLATASFDFYAEVIGARLGFETVVATRSVWDVQDRLVAAVDGDNCYGAAKLAMLTVAIGTAPTDRVFYSDHHSDAPCFAWAGNGEAVNPTPKLANMAAGLAITIVDWNKAGGA